MSQPPTPINVVQAQLDAYNRQDIQAFAQTFAPDALVYNTLGDAEPSLKGREAIAARYGELFKNYPLNKSVLIGRMLQGDCVIDHELITGRGNEPLRIMAIYEVKNGYISRCWFIR